MADLNLRVKCRSGQHVISRLSLSISVAELKDQLAKLTGVPAPSMRILHGYPPRPLDLLDPVASLDSLALRSGDTLIVEEGIKEVTAPLVNGYEGSRGASEQKFEGAESETSSRGKVFGGGVSDPVQAGASSSSIKGDKAPSVKSDLYSRTERDSLSHRDNHQGEQQNRQQGLEQDMLQGKQQDSQQGKHQDRQQDNRIDAVHAGIQQGILMRKMVPPNNSCLFTALDYVLNGARGVNLDSAQPMRRLVARLVSEQRDTYSAGVLGRENGAYCAWILDSKSWGGAIEVSILAAHYRVEICVIDALSGRISRFGEADQYSDRVFLFYDGTHYDPVALEDPFSSSPPRTRFPTADMAVLAQASDIASEARASRQYTDLESGACRCGDCGMLLRGEAAMIAHGKETGHVRFSEV